MTVFVKQWLDCEFVRTLSTGKDLRYRMFLSTGKQLYAVIDHNGTSRRVHAGEHGGAAGYAIVIRGNVLRGKIRVKAKGEPWSGAKLHGYVGYMEGTPFIGKRPELWREGWLAGRDIHRSFANG